MNPTPARQDFTLPLVTVLLAAVMVALWALRDVLMLVGFAAVLAFALEPLVTAVERVCKPRWAMPRPAAAAIVMLVLVAIGVWAMVVAVPQLVRELSNFIAGAPESFDRLLGTIRHYATAHRLTQYLGPLGGPEAMDARAVFERWGFTLLREVGGQLGNFSSLVGLALIPLLAFYLLSERDAVENSALQFVPEEARERTHVVLGAIHRALRSYVRGQSVVCVTMGVLVGLALLVLGMPVAALLATVVGLAEVVPILGFWIAALAIVLTGWSVSPGTALAGFIAYLVINQVVGLLITPRVMGRHMRMHPFIVTVSILAGGTLLGAAGAILALPFAAAIQSVVSEFAKRPSGARGKS